MKKGLLIVISGPSGSGKGTVIEHLKKIDPSFICSISATTRDPRPGEEHGVNYYFINRNEFESRIAADEMLEYASYCENLYGTPKKEVFENLEAGRNVILEIEVQGAMQIKKKYPDSLLLMLTPPTYDSLEARLRGRKDPVAEEVIQRRLKTARDELAYIGEYDHVIVNYDNMAEDAAIDILSAVRVKKLGLFDRNEFAKNFYTE